MAEIQTTATSHRPVVRALTEVLGSGCVLLDRDVTSRSAGIWRNDSIQARVLVRPRNTEEVSQALRICHAHRQRVVAQGGLTGLVESALTDPDDVVISLERMQEIESIQDIPARDLLLEIED